MDPEPSSPASASPSAAPDGRNETPDQQMDRNWAELLQELRVAQTGIQILTGFLLTIPFSSRFGELDAVQRGVYLALVLLAAVATGFVIAPVSLHRVLFRRHRRRTLVATADRLARAGLVALGLVIAGCVELLFDVVAGRAAGLVAGGAVLLGLVVLWLVLPLRLSRDAPRVPPEG
ncbi:DUF6328 family protein [Cellulomonas sp. PhB143]|uniref:DUF6328 family protein n=1 Tax=Cellulomonas sp. PhB143 TaxID=2485186 RepID=UPI000F488037|nr:DUF6328 family protein [Cellulomonas sp. PhB143]